MSHLRIEGCTPRPAKTGQSGALRVANIVIVVVFSLDGVA